MRRGGRKTEGPNRNKSVERILDWKNKPQKPKETEGRTSFKAGPNWRRN